MPTSISIFQKPSRSGLRPGRRPMCGTPPIAPEMRQEGCQLRFHAWYSSGGLSIPDRREEVKGAKEGEYKERRGTPSSTGYARQGPIQHKKIPLTRREARVMVLPAFVIRLLWKRKPQGLHGMLLRFFFDVRSRGDGTSPPGSPRGSSTERRQQSTCDTVVP